MVTRIQPVQSKHERKPTGTNRGLVIILLLCAVAGFLCDRLIAQELERLTMGQTIRVFNTETEELMTIGLEEYIVGVVAAEMPASFELDALKAQAVAARTYALNRIQNPSSKVTALHPDAQITTSPEICQAWISEDTQRNRWGSNYDKWHSKIQQAVTETAGEVLQYDGALIEPVYHASCGGGYTEDVVNVWGTAKPYLISVPCNHPADKHSNTTLTLTLKEFSDKLNLQGAVAAGAMGAQNYIRVTQKTDADRVVELRIGDQIIRGGTLRSALGLKSTLVSWSVDGRNIIFTTNGYGHGAGMCQHGADYYAKQGYDYWQILAHYYPGTELNLLQQ